MDKQMFSKGVTMKKFILTLALVVTVFAGAYLVAQYANLNAVSAQACSEYCEGT